MRVTTTQKSDYGPCLSSGYRRCGDGSCVPRVDLCPEEEMMNQNTILIMIVVGMVVVVFLIILYCFQQRSRRLGHNTNQGAFEGITDDEGFNSFVNTPPPTYEEVVNTDLYPATPVFQRNARTSSTEEPRTPPPNYDAALNILANSQDSVFPIKTTETRSPVVRRSISSEFGSGGNSRSSRSSETDYRRLFSSPERR